jgi:hypothetical protein
MLLTFNLPMKDATVKFKKKILYNLRLPRFSNFVCSFVFRLPILPFTNVANVGSLRLLIFDSENFQHQQMQSD